MAITVEPTAGTTAIRPFTVEIPEADLEDLRARIAATRWPEKETVDDQSQGVQLATIQALARYWATEYDWRRCEARLNALPNFITEIDGLDIHFIHVRSKHENALPLIVTPRVAGLGRRAAEDHRAADRPDRARRQRRRTPSTWSSRRCPATGSRASRPPPAGAPTASRRAWVELMKRLGYDRYVAQGGDWGAIVVDLMAAQERRGAGRHPHQHGRCGPARDRQPVPAGHRRRGQRARHLPAGLSDEERGACEQLDFLWKHVAYALQMGSRPQTLTGLADSPVFLAALMLDHDARSLALISRVLRRACPKA